MKTMKIKSWVIIILLSISSTVTFAQDNERIEFDVNGLYIGGPTYTYGQVVEALGEPLKHDYQRENDVQYDDYTYKRSKFTFTNGELTEFWIKDPQFECFGGKVNIGCKLSIVENLPGCQFVLRSDQVYDNVTYSDLFTGYSEQAVSIGHKNGVIVSVSYSDPL